MCRLRVKSMAWDGAGERRTQRVRPRTTTADFGDGQQVLLERVQITMQLLLELAQELVEAAVDGELLEDLGSKLVEALLGGAPILAIHDLQLSG